MKSLSDILAKNEKLIKTYHSKFHLTNNRIIYLKRGINKHFKDISLSSIDSVEYTKRRYLWIIASGFFVLFSSLVLSFLLIDYIYYSLGTGVSIFIISILIFVYLTDKDVIIYARNTQMDIKGVGMDFIRELRGACYTLNKDKTSSVKE